MCLNQGGRGSRLRERSSRFCSDESTLTRAASRRLDTIVSLDQVPQSSLNVTVSSASTNGTGIPSDRKEEEDSENNPTSPVTPITAESASTFPVQPSQPSLMNSATSLAYDQNEDSDNWAVTPKIINQQSSVTFSPRQAQMVEYPVDEYPNQRTQMTSHQRSFTDPIQKSQPFLAKSATNLTAGMNEDVEDDDDWQSGYEDTEPEPSDYELSPSPRYNNGPKASGKSEIEMPSSPITEQQDDDLPPGTTRLRSKSTSEKFEGKRSVNSKDLKKSASPQPTPRLRTDSSRWRYTSRLAMVKKQPFRNQLEFGYSMEIKHQNQAKFKNPKDEVLKHAKHPIEIAEWNLLLKKAIFLSKRHAVRHKKLTVKEIVCLKLYTDFDDLQRAFRQSFREQDDAKRLQLQKQYYNWYAEIEKAVGKSNDILRGNVFHGITVKIPPSTFSGKYHGMFT